MKVVVCIKHILDPELPPSSFEIDTEHKQALIGNDPLVLDPYSGNALEMALQLKDKNPGVQVTALTFGNKQAEDSLRKALGVMADEAIHLLQEDDHPVDAYSTARALAAAIKKIGPVDIIFCGRQAGDWDAGLVGPLLAEELSMPSVCFINKAGLNNNKLTLSREVEGGTQNLESDVPVLLTVTNDESNVLRIGKVRDVMKAHRKEIREYTLTDLGLDLVEFYQSKAYTELIEIYQPTQDNVCEILEGEDPEEKVITLLEKLKARKVL